VYGVVFRGRRYDTGDRLDYLKAVIQIAVERQDLGPELRTWLRQFVAGMSPEPAVDDLQAVDSDVEALATVAGLN
jgi:UTP--glucose-1-phosphate uridylyltransferase